MDELPVIICENKNSLKSLEPRVLWLSKNHRDLIWILAKTSRRNNEAQKRRLLFLK